MKKKITIGIIILFGLILIWRIGVLIFSSGADDSKRSGRPPVAVEIDSIQFGQITEIRNLTGTVFPEYRYVIAPKVTGRITAIYKRIGDWVNSGELVAKIDDAEYQQNVIEAEANLKIAEASLTEARIQFELASQEKERVVLLQEKGIASPSELDAAISNYSAQESRYQLALAQVDQRKAALKSASIRLGYTRLTASQAGFIGERFVDEGALLAPNAAVVSVLGIDSVIVRTTIIERDYGYIKKGQKAWVMVDAFAGHRFPGTVSRIAPMLQQDARVAQMELTVVNDSLFLKPGMFARVEVKTAEKDNAQQVPSRAVVNREGHSGVYIVKEGENIAHFIPVTVGISGPEFTEIITPELEGRIITLGQHLLDEGSPVILPQSGDGAQHEDKESVR